MDQEFWSIFEMALRTCLFFQIPAVIGNTIFIHKACGFSGKLREIVIYFAIRFSLLDTLGIVGMHYYEANLHYRMIYSFVLLALNLATLWVTWRNFSGSFIKITVAIWMGDILNAGLTSAIGILINYIAGAPDLLNVNEREINLPLDLLVPVAYGVAYYFILQLLKPLLSRYKQLKLKRIRILWLLTWACFFIMGSASFDVLDERYYQITSIVAMIGIWAVFVLFWIYRKRVLWERSFLAKKWNVIFFDIQQMQKSYQQTEASIQSAHKLIEKIQKYGFEVEDSAIHQYLDEMKQKYHLISKTYTEHQNLNAALVYEESICRHMGIETDFSVRQLQLKSIEEEDLIRLLLEILDTVILQMNEKKPGKKAISYEQAEKNLRLQLMSERGQLLIVAMWPGKQKKWVLRRLKAKINRSKGSLGYTYKQGVSCLELMLENG